MGFYTDLGKEAQREQSPLIGGLSGTPVFKVIALPFCRIWCWGLYFDQVRIVPRLTIIVDKPNIYI